MLLCLFVFHDCHRFVCFWTKWMGFHSICYSACTSKVSDVCYTWWRHSTRKQHNHLLQLQLLFKDIRIKTSQILWKRLQCKNTQLQLKLRIIYLITTQSTQKILLQLWFPTWGPELLQVHVISVRGREKKNMVTSLCWRFWGNLWCLTRDRSWQNPSSYDIFNRCESIK